MLNMREKIAIAALAKLQRMCDDAVNALASGRHRDAGHHIEKLHRALGELGQRIAYKHTPGGDTLPTDRSIVRGPKS